MSSGQDSLKQLIFCWWGASRSQRPHVEAQLGKNGLLGESEENHEGFSRATGDFGPPIRSKNSYFLHDCCSAPQQWLCRLGERIKWRRKSEHPDDFKRRGGECDSDKRRSRLANKCASQLPSRVRHDDQLWFGHAGRFDDGHKPPTDSLRPESRNGLSLPRAFHRCAEPLRGKW